MNKTRRRLSTIVVLTSVLLLGILALSTGISSEDSSLLNDWNGTWVNVGTMLDDPAMNAVYEAIADAANVAAGDGTFTADDARSFLYAMHESNFGDLGIAGNNVTYYNTDGTVRCDCEYESAGVETVAFDGEEFDWYKFERTSEDAACSEYKYLIFTAVHSHEGGMVHWHMRYGNTRFNDLINNTSYAMWWPTFGVEGTTVEEVADGYAEGAEMMGYMMLASRRPTEWHVYDGESIQAAINNTSAGDTVIVHEGIYEEQLYIAKSLDLKAAEGESPEILAPEPMMLESYGVDLEMFPGKPLPISVTPVIMVNGSSNEICVDITGFVINGRSVTPENSEYGICGIVYYNADGAIEGNEIKNIWGLKEEEGEPPYPWDGIAAFILSESNIAIHGNNIHDYTGVESIGIQIAGSGAIATVTENTITGARSVEFTDQCGILTSNYATATVNDNNVRDHSYHEEGTAWFGSPGIAFCEANGSAQGNTLIDNHIGFWAEVGGGRPRSTVSIMDNLINASGLSEVSPYGIGLTIFWPPFELYEEEPTLTATVKANQLIGGSGNGISVGYTYCREPEHYSGYGTVNATITKNIVSDWERGIELLENSNSVVYLNDFANNTQNVFVSESTNVYSSPEKLGYTYEGRDYTNYLGNYWSDYDGGDANADGIGDTPYDITGGNPDEYPLMERFGNY